jgi:DNA-binding NtrC family response regulator
VLFYGIALNRAAPCRTLPLMKKASLLLVDDDRYLLDSMAAWLGEQGYAVHTASDGERACKALVDHAPDLALIDVRLGDEDGFALLAQFRKLHPETTVVLMTGYGTVETGIEAIRAGAFDLVTKPLIDEELEMAINRALSQRKVIEENKTLKAQLDLRFGLENIVGHDHRMLRVYDVIESIADTRATVLITGESGTGKSLIARAIHRRSERRDQPFIEVACGALPESLLESELFGHVAGAFTGAVHDKLGKFMQANNGSIFLDEIGTASPGMQVKLLRVLQEFEFEQVGGDKTFHVDTRVILATNEDLASAVAAGRFRQDLFYRVNVINIELPSLRERVADIPLLAQHFFDRVCRETGKTQKRLSDEAISALQRYNWPGNVRELQNVVERAVLLSKSNVITPDDLPHNIAAGILLPIGQVAPGHGLKNALEAPERAIILEILESNNWNRNLTAEALGINRTTLYKKMKRLGLEPPRYSGRR